MVTFVPHSSELFQSVKICRTLSQAAKCNQLTLKQTVVGKIGSTLCFPCGFGEQMLLALLLKLWRIPSISHRLGLDWGRFADNLKALDTLTIFYHQRRMEFTVVWTKLLDGKSEYQVGLQAFSQEKEGWGMNLFNPDTAVDQRLSNVGSSLNRGNIMRYVLDKLWSDEEGQDIAEYSVMLAVVLVIVVSAVRLIGSNAGNVFSQVGSAIQ